MNRPFLSWPDKRLSTVTPPVENITKEIRALWDEMVAIMDGMPGYGLAAPQIGVMRRLAVVDCSEERGQAIRLANPQIVSTSTDTFDWDEASPNLPGFSARITRPRRITVAFTDVDGQKAEREFENIWATSVQHQIDHLNGKMFFDRLSRTKRAMFLKKAVKRR